MKKLIAIAILALTLSSCAIFQSKETRAQRHLGRAISLDPTIIKSTKIDSVVITDSVRIKDSIVLKDSINVITKDSTIIIPKSDLNGDIDNPCDSINGLSKFDYTLGSGVHRLHIWSDGKRIRYSSTVDSLVSKIQSRDTYIQKEKETWSEKEKQYLAKITSLEKNTLVIKEKTPFLRKVFNFLSIFLPGLFIGYVLRRFRVI